MVAQGTGIQDAGCALEVRYCGVAEIDVGFGGAGCEFGCVFVEVVEVVLCMRS